MKKLQSVAWVIGTIVTLFVSATGGLWFWVSKHSWVSYSTDANGVYTHCLDIQFKDTKIAASIVTKLIPTEYHSESDGAVLIRVAAKLEDMILLFPDLQDRVAQIPPLRTSHYISILEGTPILNHIPDMDFKDDAGKPLGTVSLTLSLDNLSALPTKIVAAFKSTTDLSIENKEFTRSDDSSQDERCLIQ